MPEQILTHTTADNFYHRLLRLYPPRYRQRFGSQMLYTFQDLYQAELQKNGQISLGFWLSTCYDTCQSAIREHFYAMNKSGFKSYWHLNYYNLIGFFCLIPFVLIFLY